MGESERVPRVKKKIPGGEEEKKRAHRSNTVGRRESAESDESRYPDKTS